MPPVQTRLIASLQKSGTPEFSQSVWDNLASWLHGKKGYTPDMLTEPEPCAAIEETRRILAGPLNSLSQEIPPELTAALDENIFYFSGFKTHHELVEASRMLKDDNGGFKPFNQFLKDVETINNTYNRNYLNAEYNFATASTQMAVKWKGWEADGDDYDLQYRTAGDDQVREEHAALDGVTLPPSDPFWNHYLPPNGWNCRCTTVQVRRGKYPQSNSEEAIARGQACTAKPKQQIFRFNPGKQEKVFPPKHPYFPKGCGNCQYKQLENNPGSVQCQACRAILQNKEKEIKRREENRKEYERLKKDPNYKYVKYDEISGAVRAEHKGHIVHDKNEERFFKELTKNGKGLTSTQLERCCQSNVFSMGHKAILQNEKTYRPDGTQLPALDLNLDGKLMDIASITTAQRYGNALMAKNRQLGNVKRQTGVESDSVCLYFHSPNSFSEVQLLHDIEWYKQHIVDVGSHQRIRHIYVVVNKSKELKIYDI